MTLGEDETSRVPRVDLFGITLGDRQRRAPGLLVSTSGAVRALLTPGAEGDVTMALCRALVAEADEDYEINPRTWQIIGEIEERGWFVFETKASTLALSSMRGTDGWDRDYWVACLTYRAEHDLSAHEVVALLAQYGETPGEGCPTRRRPRGPR